MGLPVSKPVCFFAMPAPLFKARDDVALGLPVHRKRVALKPHQRQSPWLATRHQLGNDVRCQQREPHEFIDARVVQTFPNDTHKGVSNANFETARG